LAVPAAESLPAGETWISMPAPWLFTARNKAMVVVAKLASRLREFIRENYQTFATADKVQSCIGLRRRDHSGFLMRVAERLRFLFAGLCSCYALAL
jgi:hypothetical protein